MSDTNNREEEAQVEGERGAGITSIAEDNSRSSIIFRIASVVVIAVLGLGFLYVTWETDEPAPEDDRQTTISPAVPFTPATLPRAPEPSAPAPQQQQQPAPQPTETDGEPQNDMLEASMRAPVIAFSANINQDRRQQAGGGGAVPDDFSFDLPPGLAGPQQQQDRLRDKLQATKLEGVRASVLPDLHMVVPQGTSIPCVLQTAVSSDQPGFVSCVIQRDVLSASGQVVLMEKGTTVVGEYNGGLRQGQKRIFVLWNRARTPRGVIIDLASPAADGLGRTGFSGKIDTHFWKRFGGAILMSIVSDASKYAFDQLTDRTEIETAETESATRGAAAVALENSINIPPTLYKNQGELVSIFVARDLDFSSVYNLHVTEGRNTIYDRTVSGDMRAAPKQIFKK